MGRSTNGKDDVEAAALALMKHLLNEGKLVVVVTDRAVLDFIEAQPKVTSAPAPLVETPLPPRVDVPNFHEATTWSEPISAQSIVSQPFGSSPLMAAMKDATFGPAASLPTPAAAESFPSAKIEEATRVAIGQQLQRVTGSNDKAVLVAALSQATGFTATVLMTEKAGQAALRLLSGEKDGSWKTKMKPTAATPTAATTAIVPSV